MFAMCRSLIMFGRFVFFGYDVLLCCCLLRFACWSLFVVRRVMFVVCLVASYWLFVGVCCLLYGSVFDACVIVLFVGC